MGEIDTMTQCLLSSDFHLLHLIGQPHRNLESTRTQLTQAGDVCQLPGAQRQMTKVRR